MKTRRNKSGLYAKMPLNYDELRAFIDTIEVPEYKLMVAMIVANGLRAGEVVDMAVRDVTGTNMLVRKTKCRRGNDGRKKKPYRENPKPAWLQSIMDEVISTLKRKSDDYLFQKQRGGGQLTVNGVNDRLARIFEKVATDQKVTCHTLRKTAAVKLDESCGHDLSITQKFLDHASIANTGIYINKSRVAFESAYKTAFA